LGFIILCLFFYFRAEWMFEDCFSSSLGLLVVSNIDLTKHGLRSCSSYSTYA